MQKINPCLWFDHNAEEAVNLYTRHLQELEDSRRRPLRRSWT